MNKIDPQFEQSVNMRSSILKAVQNSKLILNSSQEV